MATTDVKYLGLDLKSPVVVSSCSLTADVDKVKEMESCGAGAVVMKSLFEEQIRGEVEFMASAGHSYPEMDDYLHAYIRSNSIAQYTEKVRALKQAVSIPVIASINCYSAGEWVEYARQIEAAGADALEINLYDIALDPKTSPASIEDGICERGPFDSLGATYTCSREDRPALYQHCQFRGPHRSGRSQGSGDIQPLLHP